MFTQICQKVFFLSCILFAATVSYAGVSYSKTISHTLGSTVVKIMVIQNGRGPTFVSLHNNERTAVNAASGLRGRFVLLRHSGGRNIKFILDGKGYSFDPNRVFTQRGIQRTLKPYSKKAHKAVSGFASAVLRNVRGRIIALHNNTNGSYSVLSYRQGKLKRSAARVYIHPETDPDDFFFVLSSRMFNRFKAKGYNVVLQSGGPTDDGSLSVYCASRCRSYVNVEAQHGHGSMQRKMLKLVK